MLYVTSRQSLREINVQCTILKSKTSKGGTIAELCTEYLIGLFYEWIPV